MINKWIYKTILSLCCFTSLYITNAQDVIPVKNPAPYIHKAPFAKINNVGIYPKLVNVKTGWSGNVPGSYAISFKIKGIKPGDEVYLADNYNGGKYLRDTTIVDKKGIAKFTGNIILQRGMYLFVFPEKKGYFEFIVDDDQEFSIAADTSYFENAYYDNMVITGSEQNSAFAKYQKEKIKFAIDIVNLDIKLKDSTLPIKIKNELLEQRSVIFNNKNNYDRLFINTNPTHLVSRFLMSIIEIDVPKILPKDKNGVADSSYPYRYYKQHYFDNIDFAEDGLMRMPLHIIKQKLDYYWDKIEIMDPDTACNIAIKLADLAKNTIDLERFIIWYHINKFETSNIMGMDKAFVNFAKYTYLNGKAWWADSSMVGTIGKNVKERSGSLIGLKAPDIMLQTYNTEIKEKTGSTWVNVNEIPAKWKILLFWDPTCGHCKEVVPELAKIFNRNIEKNWQVYGLTQDDKKKEFDEFMKLHPEVQNWIHLDRSAVTSPIFEENLKKYYAVTSPTIFVLDENNVIQANRMDVNKLEEFITQLEKFRLREKQD